QHPHSNIYVSDAVATAIVKPPNVDTQVTLKAPTDLCILEHTTNALVSSLRLLTHLVDLSFLQFMPSSLVRIPAPMRALCRTCPLNPPTSCTDVVRIAAAQTSIHGCAPESCSVWM
ncbi:hypothetical protein BDR04DRAFT_1022212, partial [Suillus decipiens]